MLRSGSPPGAAPLYPRTTGTIMGPLSPRRGLPEIEFLVADVDNAVVLEKEIGTQQTAELVSQILRSGRQRSNADDSCSQAVPADAHLRSDSSPDCSGFRMDPLGINP